MYRNLYINIYLLRSIFEKASATRPPAYPTPYTHIDVKHVRNTGKFVKILKKLLNVSKYMYIFLWICF